MAFILLARPNPVLSTFTHSILSPLSIYPLPHLLSPSPSVFFLSTPSLLAMMDVHHSESVVPEHSKPSSCVLTVSFPRVPFFICLGLSHPSSEELELAQYVGLRRRVPISLEFVSQLLLILGVDEVRRC